MYTIKNQRLKNGKHGHCQCTKDIEKILFECAHYECISFSRIPKNVLNHPYQLNESEQVFERVVDYSKGIPPPLSVETHSELLFLFFVGDTLNIQGYFLTILYLLTLLVRTGKAVPSCNHW